jgi:hypothetical protein
MPLVSNMPSASATAAAAAAAMLGDLSASPLLLLALLCLKLSLLRPQLCLRPVVVVLLLPLVLLMVVLVVLLVVLLVTLLVVSLVVVWLLVLLLRCAISLQLCVRREWSVMASRCCSSTMVPSTC